jgi:hypothetical protein
MGYWTLRWMIAQRERMLQKPMEELHYPPINYSHPLETAGPMRQLLGVAIDWALVGLGPGMTYGV